MIRDQLRCWYEQWCEERQRLTVRDGSKDDPVHSTEWHASDDDAVDLMHALAAALFTNPDSRQQS